MNIRPSSSLSSEGKTIVAINPREELLAFVQAVHVMKMYAASEGLLIPENTRERLAQLVPIEAALAEDPLHAPADRLTLGSWGTTIQAALSVAMTAHAGLLEVVAPATPASISYTEAPTTFADFLRRQWLISFLVIIALLSVAGLISTIIWKNQLGEADTRVGTVQDSITYIDKRLGDMTKVKSDPETYSASIAAIVTDLEQRNQRVKSELSSAGGAATDWPDDEIMLAITDIADQNATIESGVRRVHDAIQGFRTKHRFDSSGGSWHGSVCDQLLNICSAMLGATFFALYTANKFIVQRTFDRAYTTQYIVRLALGLVAGVILANFGQYLLRNKVSGSPSEEALMITQTLLALIGGYAADAVNSILTRVSDTIQTLVIGKAAPREDRPKPAADTKP